MDKKSVGYADPPLYTGGNYCRIEPGDTFKDGRYVAQKKLGSGIFAIVWLAWDTIHSQYVAIKLQTRDFYHSAKAKAEIDILQQIASKDHEDQRCVVKLLDHFIHRFHVCMVFEYLGDNLVELIKFYGPKGLPLRLVKHICLHILDGLDYFHSEFSLIHGNIKSENICLVSTVDPSLDPRKSGASPILPPKQKCNDKEETSKIAETCPSSLEQLVLSDNDVNSVESRKKELLESVDHRCKLIDFGHVWLPGTGDFLSAQPVPYRPPEYILDGGLSFSTSADLWSFACVCFELATGQYLFPAQGDDGYCEEEDHLSLMKQHLDRIPPAMIARAMPCSKKWFDNKGRLRNVPTRYRRTIKERLVEDYNFNERDATELGDFLKWILKYEPTERPTAAKCRRHKWFNDVKDDHVISTSGPREETKLKNVNVVEDDHFISKSKENGAREKTKLNNVNVVEVEDEHFTSKSKENGDYKCKRESKKKNVFSSGRRKKALMETTDAKAMRCRGRCPRPSDNI